MIATAGPETDLNEEEWPAMLSLLCALVLASSPRPTPSDRLEDDVRAYEYAYLSQCRHDALDALMLEDDNREAQMVTRCSHAPVSVVYVVRDQSERAVVVSATLKREFWADVLVERCIMMTGGIFGCPLVLKTRDQLESIYRPNIVRRKAPLSSSSYDLIKRVWTAALLNIGPKPHPGLDGVTYYFADFKDGIGYRTGSTWSPDEGTKLAALVSLGDLLSLYARSEDEELRSKVEAQLVREAQMLLARFSSSAPEKSSSSTR